MSGCQHLGTRYNSGMGRNAKGVGSWSGVTRVDWAWRPDDEPAPPKRTKPAKEKQAPKPAKVETLRPLSGSLVRLANRLGAEKAETLSREGVYVVTAPWIGRFKIGFSSSIRARLHSLETGCPFPLEIVAWIPGGYDLEQRLHFCLAEHRAHLEWFHDTEIVRATLSCAAREHGGIWLL